MNAELISVMGVILSDNFKGEVMDKSEFNFHFVEERGYVILTVSGEIDTHTALQFKQSVVRVLNEDQQHLIIDMHNINYMDTSGLGILAYAEEHLSINGGTVNLVGCKPIVDNIFCATHLPTFIALHQCMDDAMEAISI